MERLKPNKSIRGGEEDPSGEGVAAAAGAAESLGEGFVFEFVAGDDVPDERGGDDGDTGDTDPGPVGVGEGLIEHVWFFYYFI